MSVQPLPTGPDPEAITAHIRAAWPETDIFSIEGATFFSFDPESHWPSFATLVWADATDQVSELSRPGVFRLNIGLGRATFLRLVGSVADPDYAALDRFLPHPDYARQLWVSILNPSKATFHDVVVPLLAEAHERLAATHRRHARSAS
jgi:hypothetical protein